MIGVSSNDISGAEKAANDDNTPREGEPGEPGVARVEEEGGEVDQPDGVVVEREVYRVVV